MPDNDRSPARSGHDEAAGIPSREPDTAGRPHRPEPRPGDHPAPAHRPFSSDLPAFALTILAVLVLVLIGNANAGILTAAAGFVISTYGVYRTRR